MGYIFCGLPFYLLVVVMAMVMAMVITTVKVLVCSISPYMKHNKYFTLEFVCIQDNQSNLINYFLQLASPLCPSLLSASSGKIHKFHFSLHLTRRKTSPTGEEITYNIYWNRTKENYLDTSVVLANTNKCNFYPETSWNAFINCL